MGLIKDFETYLNETKDEIVGINSLKIVTEEGQLTKYLNDHQTEDNYLLLAIMPNFSNNNPKSADEYMDTAFTEINVLKKIDFADMDYQDFIDIYDESLALIQLIKLKLLNDHTDQSCNFLRMLNPSSLITTDVFNLHQCNGWNLTFSFDIRV